MIEQHQVGLLNDDVFHWESQYPNENQMPKLVIDKYHFRGFSIRSSTVENPWQGRKTPDDEETYGDPREQEQARISGTNAATAIYSQPLAS